MALRREITTAQAAKAIGVSKNTMRARILAAGVSPYRIDRFRNGRVRYVYLESDIERLQKRNSRGELLGDE